MPKDFSNIFKRGDIKNHLNPKICMKDHDCFDSECSDTYNRKITDFFKHSIKNFGMNLYYLSKNCDQKRSIFQKRRFCKKQKRFCNTSLPKKNFPKIYESCDLENLCDKMSGLEIHEKPDRNVLNLKLNRKIECNNKIKHQNVGFPTEDFFIKRTEMILECLDLHKIWSNFQGYEEFNRMTDSKSNCSIKDHLSEEEASKERDLTQRSILEFFKIVKKPHLF